MNNSGDFHEGTFMKQNNSGSFDQKPQNKKEQLKNKFLSYKNSFQKGQVSKNDVSKDESEKNSGHAFDDPKKPVKGVIVMDMGDEYNKPNAPFEQSGMDEIDFYKLSMIAGGGNEQRQELNQEYI